MLEPIVIPADLSELTDEELELLEKEVRERAELLASDDEAVAEAGDEAVALMENALAGVEQIDGEIEKRDTAKAEAAQILADTRARLAAKLAGEEEPEETPEDAEPVAEGDEEPVAEEEVEVVEEEPVLVAATKPRRSAPGRRQREQVPQEAAVSRQGPKIIALSSIPGEVEMGTELSRKKAAELVSQKWNRTHQTDGPREDIPLVRFSVDTPEERMLRFDDEVGNWAKIDAVMGQQALVASGGLCAPVEPYYDLQLLSTEATPVIDSLPRFGADRGGIRFMAPPTLASISTAVGTKTAAQDGVGGTTATKTCQALPCPSQTQVLIDAVYHCLTIGNFGARTWPELVENFMALTMAAHARTRETKALDAIAAGSTALTGAQYNGATNTLLGHILQLADGIRSRQRMATNTKFRAWFPDWVRGLLVEDIVRGQFNRFEKNRDGVVELLRFAGIEPTFYIDSPTAGGQVFGAQGAGAILNYPSTMIWFLAPEGTWLRLDGGELDLGIVRDSVLNATNDFQAFGEVFENYANIGIESFKITSTICGNGVVSAPAAPTGC